LIKNNRNLEKNQGIDGGEKSSFLLGLSINRQTSKFGAKNEVRKYTIFREIMSGNLLFVDRAAARLWHLQRRIYAWCCLADRWEEKGASLKMITLTYRPGEKWKVGDINIFLRKLKRRKGIRVLAIAWVGELQKRGAVHFHVLVYVKGKIPKPDKSGMWIHGMTKVELARSPFYLLVHTGKEYQKDFYRFPKGMRAFGVWVKDKNDREELKFSMVSIREEALVRGLGPDQAKEILELEKEIKRYKYLGTVWSDPSLVKDAMKNETGELPAPTISG
jgi:hypothetical protein